LPQPVGPNDCYTVYSKIDKYIGLT